MGLYDYVVCDLPLPGTKPKWLRPGHQFQTKDTPCQYMKTYTIGADGILIGPEDGPLDYTGTIEFGCTNRTGGWGDVVYSANGEDVEDASYRAIVVGGRVTSLDQTHYERHPAIVHLPGPEKLPTVPYRTDGKKRASPEVLLINGPSYGNEMFRSGTCG